MAKTNGGNNGAGTSGDGENGDAPLIDLNEMSKQLYETWGPEKSLKAFVHFPANTFPGQDKALADNTHFSTYGAYELAKCVANGIMRSGISLATGLDADALYYPVVFEKFYWPMSGFVGTVKPDGN